jgi:hypothetical protein
MGYQESYVRVANKKNFDKLVNIIRKVGREYYEENGCSPVEIITLNISVKGSLEWMCMPNKKYNFPKGEKFVYFAGERYLQRNVANILNNEAIRGVEIYFTECFPSRKIFEENIDNKYATHEEFTWVSKEDIKEEFNSKIKLIARENKCKFRLDCVNYKECHNCVI